MARKALILARTIGRQVNLDEIAVENLVPEALRGPASACRVPGSGRRARRGGRAARKRRGRAGRRLKYVATIPAAGPIAVGVREVPTSSLLGALQGPENVVVMRTARYDANPLDHRRSRRRGGRHRRRHDERHAGARSVADAVVGDEVFIGRTMLNPNTLITVRSN